MTELRPYLQMVQVLPGHLESQSTRPWPSPSMPFGHQAVCFCATLSCQCLLATQSQTRCTGLGPLWVRGIWLISGFFRLNEAWVAYTSQASRLISNKPPLLPLGAPASNSYLQITWNVGSCQDASSRWEKDWKQTKKAAIRPTPVGHKVLCKYIRCNRRKGLFL